MTPTNDIDELRKIVISVFDDGRIAHASDKSPAVCEQYIDRGVALLTDLIQQETAAARIDENGSILSVAEHEIEIGDKCYSHDKHTPACYACRKRKMYVEYSKDWQRSILERLVEIQKGAKT